MSCWEGNENSEKNRAFGMFPWENLANWLDSNHHDQDWDAIGGQRDLCWVHQNNTENSKSNCAHRMPQAEEGELGHVSSSGEIFSNYLMTPLIANWDTFLWTWQKQAWDWKKCLLRSAPMLTVKFGCRCFKKGWGVETNKEGHKNSCQCTYWGAMTTCNSRFCGVAKV